MSIQRAYLQTRKRKNFSTDFSLLSSSLLSMAQVDAHEQTRSSRYVQHFSSYVLLFAIMDLHSQCYADIFVRYLYIAHDMMTYYENNIIIEFTSINSTHEPTPTSDSAGVGRRIAGGWENFLHSMYEKHCAKHPQKKQFQHCHGTNRMHSVAHSWDN